MTFSAQTGFFTAGGRGLIKGAHFLFISGPHPPTQSSCLLIPPLQNCPQPPTPGPPAGVLPACASARSTPGLGGGWGTGEAIRFVSACSRLSANKSSLSRAGVVTEEEEEEGRGASLSGFYSNPGTHIGLGGSKGCRGG